MKAKFITFVRGLKNGTPPRFQSYLKSLTLLLVMLMSVNMWGAALKTSDLNFGTPAVSEDFNAVTLVKISGNSSSATTSSKLTTFGIFTDGYIGKNTSEYYAIVAAASPMTSKYFEMAATSTGINMSFSRTFANTGAYSFTIAKSSKGFIGLYTIAASSEYYAKAKSSVFLNFTGSKIQIGNGSGWVDALATLPNTDLLNITVIYNNTTSASTYGNNQSIGAKRAHIFVNGERIESNNSATEFTIPGTDLKAFRVAYNTSGTMKVDDIKVYDELPASAAPASPCTVTFDAGSNGTLSCPSCTEGNKLTEASAGAGVTLPGCTANDGWKFLGWATTQAKANAGTADAGKTGETYKPSADGTVYAVYKQLYKITLYRNGSSTTTDWIEDDSYTLPTNETAACEEWPFKGWVKNEIATGTTTAPSFETTASKDSKTFYAVYGKADGDPTPVTTTYTLNGNWTTDNGDWTKVDGNDLNSSLATNKYGLNSGSSTASSPQSYSNISSVQFTGTKSNSGSGTVEVWYKSGSSWVSLGSKSFNTTLTWTPTTPVDGELKMKLTRSGGNVYIASVSVTYSAATTTYKSNPDCAEKYSISSNITGQGSILWSLDGETFGETIANQPANTDVFFKLVPTSGWEIDGTPSLSPAGDIDDNGEGIYGFTMPAAPVTVSASFKQPATYIIDYDKGKFPTATGDVPEITEVTPGTNYTVSTKELSLTGYTFKGWNTDKDATTGLTNITVNDDITLYAIFTINSYNITFNPSITGGSIKVNGSSISPVSVEYKSDVTITVTPTSKYFKLTTLTYNSTDIKDTKQFTMPAGHVAIEYIFTEDEKVTVTLKNNGNTLATGGTREVYVGDPIGDLPTLTDACDPHSTTFVGWTSAQAWEGKKETFTDFVTASTVVSGNMTLNAVWAEENVGSQFTQITSTSALEAGAHYLIVGNSSSTYKALPVDKAEALTTVTPSSSKITNPNEDLIWTLEGSAGQWKIKSVSNGKYIQISGGNLTFETTTSLTFDASVSSSKFTFTSSATSGNKILSYYANGSKFNAYTSANTVYIYKASVEHSNYLTTCSSDPLIEVPTESLNGFSTVATTGNPSAAQSFTVEGFNLTANITVTAPTGYEVSLEQAGSYTSSVQLPQAGGTAYVRLAAADDADDEVTGSISIISAGATTKNITLTGEVIAAVTVTFNNNGTTTGAPAAIKLGKGGTLGSNLPGVGSMTAPITGYTFVGWVNHTDAWAGFESTLTQPLITGNETVNTDVTYDAVWAKRGNNYKLIETNSELSTDNYLFVAKSSSEAHAMISEFRSGTQAELKSVSVTTTNDIVSDPTNNMVWHIVREGNNIAIINPQTQQYIYSSYYNEIGYSSTKQLWSISSSGTAWIFRNGDYQLAAYSYENGDGSVYFSPDEDQYRDIYLYKQQISNFFVTTPNEYTVTWHKGNAGTATSSAFEGQTFADIVADAPAVADDAAGDCANKFMGWATSAITAQDGVDEDAVAWATEPISNENKDFYAVWAKGVENKQEGKPVETGEKGKSAITEITGVTQSGLGDDYTSHSPYLLKFDNTGDYIQFALDYAPKTLSFGYKMIGGNSQSTMTIQECATTDGSYTKVQDFTISGSQNSTGTKTTTSTFSQKYVRMYFTKGSNIGVGNITIEGYVGGTTYSNYITSCFIPTYSVTIQSNNTTMGSVTVDPEITEDAYEAGTEFAVMAEPTDETIYRFIGWTITPDNTGATLDDATSPVVTFTTGTGDVTLTANFEAIPADPITVTLEVGERGTLDCEDCIDNTITEKTAGEGVLVPNVNANEGWAFLGWSTSSTATEAQYKPADADIFYPSDDNKTLYAVYAQLYKVTLKYTDEVKWQTTTGGAIALPTDRNCKNETYKDHFAGWSETEFAEETTNPTETPTIYAESITPTKDVVLYPVFSVSTMGGTKWVKKTGDQVTGGVYAIITADGYAFNGTISSGHGQVTTNAFAFTNDVATSAPSGTCEITMQAVTGGFKMYNADKGYLYATAASSGNLAWDTQGTTATYWSWASDNWMYAGVTNARIRDYNNTIRTYGSNNGAVIQFAKKESVAENKYWSKPANDVTNPVLDTPAGDYLSPLTVKITSESYDKDLMYYYTTDGSTPAADAELNPTGTSAIYEPTTGIVLQPAQTFNLQVIGYDEDGYTSQIASAEYTIWATYSTLAEMYAGFQNGKPVGLTLADAYIHKVYTPSGGQTKQLFVQEKNSTLGVVLSGNVSDFDETIVADAEGKTISFTVTGEYALGNERQQIGKVKFTNYTINDVVTRPTAEEYATATIAANLIGLTKLDNVYAIAKDGNVVTVNTQSDGLGDSYKVYNIFNVVKTIPESTIACNVKGLFNVRDGQQYIMPILATDFDVVEKQDAQLPEVKPAGGASEDAALAVPGGQKVAIIPASGFKTYYSVNGGGEQEITTQKAEVTLENDAYITVRATRPYYNEQSATYYYKIDQSLTAYTITKPGGVGNYKYDVNNPGTAMKDELVILTITPNEHWNIDAVKATYNTTEVIMCEAICDNKYTFTMPAANVAISVDHHKDPTYKITYLKGDVTGVTGDDITESQQYEGTTLTLKECTWKAAGYSFVGWKAFYVTPNAQDETKKDTTIIPINDNKITVPPYEVKIQAQWDEVAWHKDGTWELVTKTDELKVGDYVIFTETVNAGTDKNRQAGTSTIKGEGKNLKTTTNISINGNKLTRTNNDGSMVFQVETGNVESTFAFYADGIGYLNANGTSDQNYMITTAEKASNNASWAVESIDATTGEAVVKAKSNNRNQMQVNVSNNIFAAYNSKQGGLAIYKFYPKAWTVTFDDNVEDEEIKVPEEQRADHITNKVTISTMVPERTGYDFSKWNSAKGGTGVTSANPGNEITLSANTTLYAQWNIKQYNVAVAEVENVTIQAKPHSEEVIAEGANADVNFKKSVVLSYSELNEDYVFKSWKVTKADEPSVEVPISVGSSTTFEVPAYAVTVSAVIESKATTQLTVTYHANGGVNKTPEGPTEVSEQVNWNTTIKFSEHPCPFEKNLCTFVGWNTKADGTGTTYKTQVTVKTDIDLYAMWKASAVEYVIDENVEAKVKVQEGVAPTGSAATFVTTYTGTFGQLTKTNSGTLTLTGYAGKVITGVKMQMKSNKGSGAGSIIVKVDDKEICSTTYKESFGNNSDSYSVAELQNFNAALVGEAENITIVVSCTDNSLYIYGYTIEYEDAPTATVIRGNLTSNQYTTYCEPQKVFAGTYTGATFWNIAEKEYMSDGIRLYLIIIEQHLGDLEAGVPYIMLPEATELKGIKYGDAVQEPVAEGNNGLYGTFVDYAFDENETDARDAQQLYVISNGTLYLCGTGCGVYANRAYIKSDMINYVAPSGAPRRTIGRPNVAPTILENVFGNQPAGKVQKVFIDGQIYIIRDTKVFNAQGQLVK
ncbi:MAG: InlB B-repeat-containing protein [Paludibacteraceae bacterium]|nr:InlB B-repeat-containing protein [Paludibacteraceae bacterium]